MRTPMASVTQRGLRSAWPIPASTIAFACPNGSQFPAVALGVIIEVRHFVDRFVHH